MYITQSLKRNAQLYPKKVATSFNERTFNWEESLNRISKLASGIKKLGVNLEDRVAILAHNSDRYFEFIYSVSWLGGVFVPINTRLAPPEIQFWINDSESKVIFVDANFSGIIDNLIKENKIPSIEKVVYISDDTVPENMIKYDDLLSSESIDDKMRGYDDGYSSGGTSQADKEWFKSRTNVFFQPFGETASFDISDNEHTS